jgi:DNA-binding response OmpR family regulator
MSGARPLVFVICDSALLSPLLLAACEAADSDGCLMADAESVLLWLEHGAPPALILVELVLGCETGFGAVRRLRECGACPLVILSGTGRASDEAWGLDAGAIRVLSYPLRVESLRELLPLQRDEVAS